MDSLVAHRSYRLYIYCCTRYLQSVLVSISVVHEFRPILFDIQTAHLTLDTYAGNSCTRVYVSQTGNVTDAHSLMAGRPVVDECTQDWTLLSAEADDESLVFEAERALDTGDAQDRAFADDTQDGERQSISSIR